MRATAFLFAASLIALPACHRAKAPHPPAGYVEVSVKEVAKERGENVVWLADARGRALPIAVGDGEALSISLRREGQKYVRPLAHDLIDSLLKEYGGRVHRVQVDDLRAGTFYGSLHVVHGNRVVTIDARPSDAIAVALGAGAPIYVSEQVLARAALPLPSSGPPLPVSSDL